MNIALWILQGLLALHTLTGAVWKLSNSAQSVPSLTAIPSGAWLALSVLEVACGLGLVVPALYQPLALLAPWAAAVIALEMLVFSGIHLSSQVTNHGPMIYWLVVAALCALVAYGRFSLRPL